MSVDQSADSVASDSVRVVHSMNSWLTQTMTWLYTQVSHLPESIESHVVCDTSENLDQFPVKNLTSLEDDRRAWRAASRISWRVRRQRERAILSRILATSGAHVLHSHFGDRGWWNLESARRSGVKHAVSFYGYDAGQLPRNVPIWVDRYRELFAAVDVVLCEGRYFGRTLESLGCPAEKIIVHHLGIDVGKIPFRPRRWMPDEPLKVLLAGTFVEKKGIPYAIEALGRLKDTVSLEIVIVGDSDSQPRTVVEKEKILQCLEKTGLRTRTRLMGFQPYSRLLELAYESHIFLSPSVTASDGDSEGGAPVTLIDMAATGMPIVSSIHCDIPGVIENGVSGFLAEEQNVDQIADCLRRLVDSPADWDEIATTARMHIERNFDAKKQGRKLGEEYRRLLAS